MISISDIQSICNNFQVVSNLLFVFLCLVFNGPGKMVLGKYSETDNRTEYNTLENDQTNVLEL